jgi:hypothetical protein
MPSPSWSKWPRGRVRALSCRRCFVIKGIRLLEETFRAGIVPALLFYGEGVNATPDGRELATSLNAAAPASVIFFEAARQHRQL